MTDGSGADNGLKARLQFQAGDPGVIHFIHTARIAHVLHVRAHSQPVGDMHAIVELDVVFAVLHRDVERVVVVGDARAVIDQALALGDVVVDLQAGNPRPMSSLGRASNGPL